MILVKPSFEIITPINGEEILKNIEFAARTCYKSEGKIIINHIPIDGKDTYKNSYAESARILIPKLIKRGHFAMLEFGGMVTVKFICDRGISHELVRHRLASFAQESTRYCNYDNNEHIQFVLPIDNPNKDCYKAEFDINNIDKDKLRPIWFDWFTAMIMAETIYKMMVSKDYGISPQIARSVLPNSLKTEINMSANLREWREIFKQRTAEAAHPQMKELMRPLLDEFKKRIPIIFDDINY